MKLPSAAVLTDYGEIKHNDAPVEDPTTDEDATNRNDLVEDVAGMTQTAARAWVRFVGVSSGNPSTILPATNRSAAVWGNAAAVPVVTRTSTGIYVVTWPSSFTDQLGVLHTVAFRGADRPNVETNSFFQTSAVLTSANVVTIYVWNVSASLTDPTGFVVSLRVW